MTQTKFPSPPWIWVGPILALLCTHCQMVVWAFRGKDNLTFGTFGAQLKDTVAVPSQRKDNKQRSWSDRRGSSGSQKAIHPCRVLICLCIIFTEDPRVRLSVFEFGLGWDCDKGWQTVLGIMAGFGGQL